MQNSKHEILNTKQYLNSNDQNSKLFRILNLKNLDLFRISDFEFRIFSKGFTLLEAVLYIGFLGIISVMIVNFMAQISNTYHILRAEREVVSNARLVLERIEKTTAQSAEIYSPTSRFDTNLGQLSLVVGGSSDPNHPTSYTDFWVDNGRLWMRREGQNAIPFSATSVKIDYFYLERIIQSLDRDAVKMTLGVSYNVPINLPIASTTLNATMSLRGAY